MLKNIIFDLGNVLLPISYERCLASFQALTERSLSCALFDELAHSLFNPQEVGKVTDQEFCELLRVYLEDKTITNVTLKNAWNTLLLSFSEETFALLESLQSKYSIYLLSNTNAIHQRAFEEKASATSGGKSLSSFFKKVYYSHELGLRKPNIDCFEHVLKDANLSALETLFVDDRLENIHSAKTLKLHTLLLKSPDKLALTVRQKFLS